jgi:hypothetical protein
MATEEEYPRGHFDSISLRLNGQAALATFVETGRGYFVRRPFYW